ncbi:Spb1 C-terminal domain-containing protein [Hysterangium stoloniferum]|nr:Spb1 C-terminal domain-containing protein [Hysterangium stoloniferum]
MGKTQKKTGKNRLDKYYKLAKEQGYRARSAFKLIQLNKKFSFLETARCCIDLCAAPGGWLQVASKYMPVNSIIVGVDLVPIKPIPRVVTFAADITTPVCRNLLRGELKDWMADVVLHDGAPNVGAAWVQDAYGQSELVLMSLKLAVEFLVKGGTFVTKVFRSVDYNNLMWVFNQLFDKVEATKPPSSRNVSAEIFVVCRGFLAPKHLDPKFLDPKHVFKDLTVLPVGTVNSVPSHNAQANVFQPEKKRRKRDGYDDGDYTLFKTAPVGDFIRGSDAVGLLGSVNKLTFQTEEEKEWLGLDITPSEVKVTCDDLKVLGKGDFKALLKWRTVLREELGLDVTTKAVEGLTDVVEVTEEVDEDRLIEDELQRINSEAAARSKRERRRANEIKTRTIQRMQLRMTAPIDIGLDLEDKGLEMGQEDVFDLETQQKERSKKSQDVTRLMDEGDEDSDEAHENENEDNEDEDLSEGEQQARKISELERELDGLYDAYTQRKSERDAKFKVKEARKKNKEREGEWSGFGTGANEESEGEDESDGGYDKVAEAKANLGEEDSDEDSDDQSVEDHPIIRNKRQRQDAVESSRSKKAKLLTKLDDPRSIPPPSKAAQVWFAQDLFQEVEDLDVVSEEEEDLKTPESETVEQIPESDEEDEFEIVPLEPDNDGLWDVADENEDEKKQEIIRKYGLVTPEAVTLAQQLVNREKTKTQLINEGFNRHSFDSRDGLPSWFLDDESKHYKANLPVMKEAVAALRAKQRALDARPIKKVAEAKARKKHRAAIRLEKAMKKAQGITETTDLSEREKASQIEKLMWKGAASAKGKRAKEQVKLVVAKGAHKGLKGRPKGVKGRYTMVDARMKKEVRARKRTEKANKKRKRS